MMCGRGENMLRSRRSTFLAGEHLFINRIIQPSLTRTGIVQINARLFKFERAEPFRIHHVVDYS